MRDVERGLGGPGGVGDIMVALGTRVFGVTPLVVALGGGVTPMVVALGTWVEVSPQCWWLWGHGWRCHPSVVALVASDITLSHCPHQSCFIAQDASRGVTGHGDRSRVPCVPRVRQGSWGWSGIFSLGSSGGFRLALGEEPPAGTGP